MVISYILNLKEALKKIHLKYSPDAKVTVHQFEVHNNQIHEINPMCPNLLERYSNALHQVTNLTNNHFQNIPHTSQVIKNAPFNLHNWIHHNTNDELAYFLSETGNNCLNHAAHKAPHRFTLYLADKGFIIAISHQGESFNAKHIDQNKLYTNEGAAFDFYRNCQNTIFFNHPEQTNEVFMLHLF